MLNRQHNLYTYDAVACERVTRAGEVALLCWNGATQVQNAQKNLVWAYINRRMRLYVI